MTSIEKLNEFGQSIWLDNISRSMIDSGKLKEMVDVGLRGMTSNPTIFDKSIRGSNDYDVKIEELTREDKSTFEIYDELTVKDVQDAGDIFKDVYERTGYLDGYVSLEVNPKLASLAEETMEEAKRLFKKVNRPNVMFKIPATDAGFVAIQELLAEGININATLIFSLGQYLKTAQAYIKGISRLMQKGKNPSQVNSVASVFVSRIDTAVDKMIDEKGLVSSLKGKASVANCQLIFQKYQEIFSNSEFRKLEKKGANVQRVLWASTSTKNPAYSDIKYVTELIGKNTINTLPENTFKAFLEHGVVEDALGSDEKHRGHFPYTIGDTFQAWKNGKLGKCPLPRLESVPYRSRGVGKCPLPRLESVPCLAPLDVVDSLREAGIDIDIVCENLLQDGLIAFEKSFDALLASIEAKRIMITGIIS